MLALIPDAGGNPQGSLENGPDGPFSGSDWETDQLAFSMHASEILTWS